MLKIVSSKAKWTKQEKKKLGIRIFMDFGLLSNPLIHKNTLGFWQHHEKWNESFWQGDYDGHLEMEKRILILKLDLSLFLFFFQDIWERL